MRFAIIDMEGSTLDSFDDVSSATAFLDRLLRETPTAAGEVGVIEYREGERLGPPMFAGAFIAKSRMAHTQAIIARALENVRIDPADMLSVPADVHSRALIDIAMPSAEADCLDAVVRQSRSHRFPLAA